MTRSHALTSLCVLALLIAPACTDDGSDADEVGEMGDGDGESSTGDGDTGETTDEGESSTSETSTTETSTTETSESTSDTSDSSDTTDSTTGEPDNSTYSAIAYPGGLDRVIITRVDPDAPSCTQMVLVLPGFDAYDVDIPNMWAIEEIRSWDQLECDPMVEPDAWGEGGTGTIEFLGTDAFDLYPCALAIDVEIDMDTDPPSWMTWFTDFVVVDGVNCG